MNGFAELLLPLAVGLIGFLGVIVVGMLGWFGAMVWRRLGEIADLLRNIEQDLRGDLAGLDRRITLIEGRCVICKEGQP